MKKSRRNIAAAQIRVREADGRRDGQAARARASPKSTNARGPATTTPTTPNRILRRRRHQDRGSQVLRRVRAARRRAGDHAVEFSVLAGLPFRRAGADGWQRRPSSSTPRTSRAARSPSRTSSNDAGFPANLFRTLLIGSTQVQAVIEHPLVRAVTLTGSTPAGKAVAAQAGERPEEDRPRARRHRDAYLVLEDADLDAAAARA